MKVDLQKAAEFSNFISKTGNTMGLDNETIATGCIMATMAFFKTAGNTRKTWGGYKGAVLYTAKQVWDVLHSGALKLETKPTLVR